MERDTNQSEDGGTAAPVEEAEGGTSGRPNGRSPKPTDPYKLQLIVPWKTVLTLGEVYLKRLKKGQDLSRARLIGEAIELLAERESGAKAAGKIEETTAR